MTYFIGKNLRSRITQFGLEELDERFQNYIQGTDPWLKPFVLIPTQPEDLEKYRATIYSMLHWHEIKQDFSVKMSGKAIEIICKRQPTSTPQSFTDHGLPMFNTGPTELPPDEDYLTTLAGDLPENDNNIIGGFSRPEGED